MELVQVECQERGRRCNRKVKEKSDGQNRTVRNRNITEYRRVGKDRLENDE